MSTISPDCEGCTCQKCGRVFKVDFNVPDPLWKRISRGRNLLCGPCIAEAIENIGQFDYFDISKPMPTSSESTCSRKVRYDDLAVASIAALRLRQKLGLSRRSREVMVYICDVCLFLHVGKTASDDQRNDKLFLAARWAEIQALRQKDAARLATITQPIPDSLPS